MDEHAKAMAAMIEQHGIRKVLDGLLAACLNTAAKAEVALGRQLTDVAKRLNVIVTDLPRFD